MAQVEVIRSYAQRVQMVTTVLGHLFPGQDVRVRARTRMHRDVLLGYWVWSLTNLTHAVCDRATIYSPEYGRDPKTYGHQIRHRTWRWQDVVKSYSSITGRVVRDGS